MTTTRPGDTATAASMADEGIIETSAPTDHAKSSHPCASRPVPASVQRQREVATDAAFARALRDANEPPVVSTMSRSGIDAAHSV